MGESEEMWFQVFVNCLGFKPQNQNCIVSLVLMGTTIIFMKNLNGWNYNDLVLDFHFLAQE